nr:Chain C, Pop-1 8-residue peptide [Caenorhabditis elegans]3C2G_D Chain D, Pop-1 8-residue peptide [Caenorhabditis elegans]
GDEVKVFR